MMRFEQDLAKATAPRRADEDPTTTPEPLVWAPPPSSPSSPLQPALREAASRLLSHWVDVPEETARSPEEAPAPPASTGMSADFVADSALAAADMSAPGEPS